MFRHDWPLAGNAQGPRARRPQSRRQGRSSGCRALGPWVSASQAMGTDGQGAPGLRDLQAVGQVREAQDRVVAYSLSRWQDMRSVRECLSGLGSLHWLLLPCAPYASLPHLRTRDRGLHLKCRLLDTRPTVS